MKRTIAAATTALVALTAPVFAQSADNTQAAAPQQVTRSASGFRVADETRHDARIQRIFDEIRAESGTGTTN